MQAALQYYALSAQQRRAFLRSPSRLSLSVCRFRLPDPVAPHAIRDAFVNLAGAHDLLRARLRVMPDQRLPLLAIGAQGEVDIAPSSVPAEAPPEDGRIEVRIDGDGRLLELRCPALLCDGTALLDLGAALTAQLGGSSSIIAPDHGYAHFAAWQSELLENAEPEARSFWDKQRERLLFCEPPAVGLDSPPGDAPGWSSMLLDLTESDSAALLEAARHLGASPGDLTLACWGALAARNRGREDFCLGVTLQGRDYAPFRPLFGPIARTVPVHIRSAATLAEILTPLRDELARQTALEDAFDWGLHDDDVRFATGFRYLETPASLAIEHFIDGDDSASLFCSVLRCGDRVQVQLDFDPSLYSEAGLHPIGRQLATLLRHVGRHPKAALPESVIDDEDRHRVTHLFNRTTTSRPTGVGAAELFYRQVRRAPDHLAILDEHGEVTYGALAAWAGELAETLRAHPAERIGLLMRPGAPMAAAMVAALIAGKPYVPLDPSDSARRRAHIVTDSGMGLLLTEAGLADDAAASGIDILPVERRSPDPRPPAVPLPDETAEAYVIYTSGTTGRPKGVGVTNRGLVNYALWLNEALGIGAGDRGALLTSPAYDLGYTVLWGTLLNGGTLHLPAQEALEDPARMLADLVAHRINFLKVTPSLLHLLLEIGSPEIARSALRMVVIGGEAIRCADLERLNRLLPAVVIVNHYGPTETTIGCIAQRIEPGELASFCRRPVLGRPIANMSVQILDNSLQPVPPGIAGEIWVGGAGLGTGYIGQPDLTARQFVAIDGIGTLYRTGDRGVWTPDGQVAFLGRIDAQVKVRGHRVEPEGIAQILAAHPGLDESVVTAVPAADGTVELVAFGVPSADRAGPVRALCRLVAQQPERARDWMELPDGSPIIGLNHSETRFMYREIVEGSCYLRHGIHARPGDVVVDAGANIGLFSLMLHREVPGVRTVAIEPAPATFARLELNGMLSGGDWTSLPAALGAVAGTADLTLYRDHSLLSTMRPAEDEDRELLIAIAERTHDGRMDEATRREIEETVAEQLRSSRASCRVLTLSDVIREQALPRIDLLKIDVQRAEWDLLRGIEEEHWPSIRQIVAEVQDDGSRLTDIRSLLEAHGFRVIVEQPDRHAGSDHHLLYALRPGPVTEFPPVPLAAWRSPTALIEDLRRHAVAELPNHAVPGRLILVDKLPLTANGKLDREALTAKAVSGLELERRLTPPVTELGRRLAGLWTSCLGTDQIGLESHFFELGGQSLIAAQLTNRIRKDLLIKVSMAEILRNPRFSDLLALLSQPGRRTLAALTPAPWGESYPLSHLQRRLWLACQFDGGSEAYNLSRAFQVSGPLDPGLLRQAAAEVTARHESVRTRFIRQDILQRTVPTEACAPQFRHDTRRHAWDGREASALATAEALRPFDLAEDVLLRALLVDFAGGEALFVLTTHHIVGDGWSVEILVNEVFDAYARLRGGQPAFSAPLQGRHKDFIYAMNQLAAEAVASAAGRLDGWADCRVAPLPYDYAAPASPSFRAGSCRAAISASVTAGLRHLAQSSRVSTFSICVAALNAVLSRWMESETVILAATVSGRDLPGSRDHVGFFANTLLLRERVRRDEPFEDLVRRTASDIVEALQHQHLPLDEVVRRMPAARRNGLSTVPAVGITWYEIETGIDLGEIGEKCGLRVSALDTEEHGARADLWFFASLTDGIDWRVTFNAALFRRERIQALVDCLARTLGDVARTASIRIADLPAPSSAGWQETDLDFTVRL